MMTSFLKDTRLRNFNNFDRGLKIALLCSVIGALSVSQVQNDSNT